MIYTKDSLIKARQSFEQLKKKYADKYGLILSFNDYTLYEQESTYVLGCTKKTPFGTLFLFSIDQAMSEDDISVIVSWTNIENAYLMRRMNEYHERARQLQKEIDQHGGISLKELDDYGHNFDPFHEEHPFNPFEE